MNTLLVFTVLFAGACMADVSHIVGKPPVAILSSNQELNPAGDYKYSYESEDGNAAQVESDANGETRGRYRFISPDGSTQEVTWTAGEGGFQASGPSIPAIPEDILRSLEYNKAHPEEDESTYKKP